MVQRARAARDAAGPLTAALLSTRGAGIPGCNYCFTPEPARTQLPALPHPGTHDTIQVPRVPFNTHSGLQPGSPGEEFLRKAGDGVVFIKKLEGNSRTESVAMLMQGWAPCQDSKWNPIPETSFNQQIFKVRITLSSQSLAKVNSGLSMQN